MMYESYTIGGVLYHHGVQGMHWGVRNGPPYPLSMSAKFDSMRDEVRSKTTNVIPRFIAEKSDIKEIKKRGKLNTNDALKCMRLGGIIFEDAARREPKITKDIVNTARNNGSKMYGLEYRLKQPTSISAKIGSDSKEDNVSYEDAAKNINDAIRYTIISNDKDYTKKYFDIKNDLAKRGYEEVRCKNNFDGYKNGKVMHKSVQSLFQNKDGYKFEVQFQTEDSQIAKELKLPIYNERRKAGLSDKRKIELEKQMRDLADFVRDPKDVEKIKSYKK